MVWADDASPITRLLLSTSRNLAVAPPGVNKFRWVEYAMVRAAIVAHQPASVQEEAHGQILQGDVVDDLIVGPLQERRIDGHNGFDLLRG